MPVIRISDKDWEAVWWELVSSGPISRLSQEPIYAISGKQLRLLEKKKLPFELVSLPKDGLHKQRFFEFSVDETEVTMSFVKWF